MLQRGVVIDPHALLHLHRGSDAPLGLLDHVPGLVRQMLLDPLTLSRPYLQKKTVETIVADHLKGTRNYTSAIHKLLTLELIHRLFLDTQ